MMMGFARVRAGLKAQVYKIIFSVIAKQANFDFNRYLSKNCPMPGDWKDRKAFFVSEEVRMDPKLKGSCYAELFKYNSNNFQVGNFLCEFFHHVLPKDFMEGKNKKLFNRKLH